MSFTISKNLEQLPSYPMLCKLAEQNHVCLAGDARAGTFSFGDLEGQYEIGEDGIRGSFAGHGVKGAFSLGLGKATVTISDKPFWLLQMLVEQKIREGLESLSIEVASMPPHGDPPRQPQ